MTVDDTYYYLKTALNVSRGLGSTFDGVNPTDGYHPLWLGILSLAFVPLPDDMVLLCRVAFTIQAVMVWAGGILLARLREAGGARVLWPLAFVLANPFAAKILLCGQETGLQFLLSSAALAMWWSLRASREGYRPGQWAGLAIVCVLAALSRLDTVFLCTILLAMPLLLPGEGERALGLAGRLRMTVLGLVVFSCGLLLFLAYRFVTYHHLMPVSGAIKADLGADEIASVAPRLAVFVVAAAGLLGFWLAARRSGSPVLALLAPPVGAALVLAIYNFGVRGEMSPSLIRIWYLEPYLLAFVLVVGVVLNTRPRRLAISAIIGGAAVLWIGFSVLAWKYRLEPRSYNLYQAAEKCSRWVERHAGASDIGAAWDAGFAGAFTRKPVMNLDGLINSWEFKEQYLDSGKVDEFILKRHPVDFVVQYAWPRTLRAIATRFRAEPLPTAPQLQTTVTGSRDRGGLSVRWGVDLASFHVAHVECVMVSVAYDPSVTVGPVFYFVLSRAPIAGRSTLAAFALANASHSSCDAFDRDE
jgi:hypothetical protein